MNWSRMEWVLSLTFAIAVVLNFFSFFINLLLFVATGNIFNYVGATMFGGLIILIFYAYKTHTLMIIKLVISKTRLRTLREVVHSLDREVKRAKTVKKAKRAKFNIKK